MGTPNLGLDHLASNQASKEVTANATFDGLDKAANSSKSIAMTDADYVVSLADFIGDVYLTFTGTLTAARNITVPALNADSNALHRFYMVKNGTTGGFKLTVKTSGGTGIDVYATDATVILYSDGINTTLVGKLVGTTAGTVAAGDDSRITGAEQSSKLRSLRSTGTSCAAASDTAIAINFSPAYADNSYTAVVSLEDATAADTVDLTVTFVKQAAGAGLTVTVHNAHLTIAHTVIVHAFARHD